ncbi:MAG: rhomboid family intramembrane serine protease [Xanthomonadaceae bacterium]|nr:rhomboid family intramembrane serine protease [Xanthomonadaceae bacterium]
MVSAPITAEAGPTAIHRDRRRVFWAVVGAMGLVAGIWLAWLGAWLLGWDMDDLGIRPRDAHGLIGILTAPFVHASFAHLMSNTLPMGLLAALALYAYPRATRLALPFIWIVSGIGVWLWARPSIHVGISGIAHGLMFYLFFMGLLRRDRLGIAIALTVFFLYGGMVMTVLPRDPQVSFEYHFIGALAGAIAAFVWHQHDPEPPRKRYSWEIEEQREAEQTRADSEFDLPSPRDVPALWEGPQRQMGGDNVVAFPRRREDGETLH